MIIKGFTLKHPDVIVRKEPFVSGKSLIYLKFKYNGNLFVYTFGQNIDPKNWNRSKQEVKSNRDTTTDGKHSLNDLLSSLKKECAAAYNKEISKGIPAPER